MNMGQHTRKVAYLFFLTASVTAAAQDARLVDERYLLLGAGKVSIMRNELADAAAAGYRVVAGTPCEREMAFILEKAVEPSDDLAYVLLGERRIRDMRKSLNEFGAKGFRLLPSTVMQAQLPSGRPIVAIMEKSSGRTEHYEYLVQEENLSSPSKKINEVATADYELVGTINRESISSFFAILEKADLGRTRDSVREGEVSTRPSSTTAQSPEGELDQRYLTVWDSGTGSVRKKLKKAAAASYRVVVASRVYFDYAEDHRRMAVILEKVATAPDDYDYLLLADNRISTVEKEINEGAAAGFRLVPSAAINKDDSWLGESGAEIVVVMEKPPSPAGRYEYLLLSRLGTDGLPEGMMQANDRGYEVVAMVNLRNLLVFVLEKDLLEAPLSDRTRTNVSRY